MPFSESVISNLPESSVRTHATESVFPSVIDLFNTLTLTYRYRLQPSSVNP
ncbi:hypothetical protein Hamer_G022837, partial [Homarus americanus]